jgi:hypothetical protein
MKVNEALKILQKLVEDGEGELELCNYIPYDCGCPDWISDNKIVIKEDYYRGSNSKVKFVGITEDYGDDS